MWPRSLARRVGHALADEGDGPWFSALGLSWVLGVLWGLFVITSPPRPANEIITIPDRCCFCGLIYPSEEPPPPRVATWAGGPERRSPGFEGPGPARTSGPPERPAGARAPSEPSIDVSQAGLLGALNQGTSPLDGAPLDLLAGPALASRGLSRGGLGRAQVPAGLPGGGAAVVRLSGAGTCGEHGECEGADLHGMIWLGKPVMGGLEPSRQAAAREAIYGELRRLRVCYHGALLRDPEAAGRVVLRFSVGTEGQVYSASIADDGVGDPALGRCLVERVKGIYFGEGPQVEVEYPLFLMSAG